MKHETNIDYKGGLDKLAEDLSRLRYDALAKFLCSLGGYITNDADKDRQRGRVKLASRLREAGRALDKATDHINVAWKISAPYEDTWVIALVEPDDCVKCYYTKDRVGNSFWVNDALKATRYRREEVDKVLEFVQGMMQFNRVKKLCLD